MFEDPDNVDELIGGFKGRDVLDYVNRIFPSLIVSTAKQFSIDLAPYNNQWETMCKKGLNVQRRCVLFVNNSYKEHHLTTHKLLGRSLELLSMAGYIVIDTNNFSRCEKCGDVIVSQEVLNRNNMIWSGMCQNCHSYDPYLLPLSSERVSKATLQEDTNDTEEKGIEDTATHTSPQVDDTNFDEVD
jgi:hypothetical protein